jgi:DNA-binding protein H-NS
MSTLADLLKQADEIAEKIKLAKAAELEACRTDALALIEGRGFTVAEIFGGVPATRGRKPKAADDARAHVAPKYRNPENHAETWTGRGRQPKWIGAKLAAGVTLESLKIG